VETHRVRDIETPIFSTEGYPNNSPSGLPHFLGDRLTDGDEDVSLTRRPAALYPQEDCRYSFLLEAESTPVGSWLAS
jgi:hypothetical protein